MWKMFKRNKQETKKKVILNQLYNELRCAWDEVEETPEFLKWKAIGDKIDNEIYRLKRGK